MTQVSKKNLTASPLSENEYIDLMDFGRFLWRGKWWALAAGVALGSFFFALSWRMMPSAFKYQIPIQLELIGRVNADAVMDRLNEKFGQEVHFRHFFESLGAAGYLGAGKTVDEYFALQGGSKGPHYVPIRFLPTGKNDAITLHLVLLGKAEPTKIGQILQTELDTFKEDLNKHYFDTPKVELPNELVAAANQGFENKYKERGLLEAQLHGLEFRLQKLLDASQALKNYQLSINAGDINNRIVRLSGALMVLDPNKKPEIESILAQYASINRQIRELEWRYGSAVTVLEDQVRREVEKETDRAKQETSTRIITLGVKSGDLNVSVVNNQNPVLYPERRVDTWGMGFIAGAVAGYLIYGLFLWTRKIT